MEVERINQLRDDGSLHLVNMIQKCLRDRSSYINFETGMIEMDFWHAQDLFDFLKHDPMFKDCMKIIHSDNARYNRLFKRIKKYMDMGTCLFVTLTFTDDVLNSTNDDTRRKYVRRFLKEYSNCFIANIDFGDKTGREHYHAIILHDDVRFIDNWVHGFSNAQVINDNPKSSERVARYILKIANHFVKASTKRCRCIYSIYREKWVYEEQPVKAVVPPDKQLCFWDHMPGNISNFDRDDYM